MGLVRLWYARDTMWAEAVQLGDTWRVVEEDGSAVYRWVPWEPAELEPLDRGGFEARDDAHGFALGVCYERALHGLIPGMTVEDVDVLRRRLDPERVPEPRPLSVLPPPPSTAPRSGRRRVIVVEPYAATAWRTVFRNRPY